MNEACRDSIQSIDAYVSGALRGERRQAMEAHVSGCPECRAELTLAIALHEARAAAATPVAQDRAQRIFHAVTRSLDAGAARPRARRAWQLSLVAAAVVVVVAVALLLVVRERPKPPETDAGWVTRADGVRAWAEPGCVASLARREQAIELDVRRGTLLVAFDRRAAPSPLRVRAPGLEVIARDAVFFVAREEGATTVGVRQGDVELRRRGQAAQLVSAYEQVRVAGQHVARQRINAVRLERLVERFGEDPVGQSAEACPQVGAGAGQAARARRPRHTRRAPRRSQSRRSSKPPDEQTPAAEAQPAPPKAPSVAEIITTARQHLDRGETARARELLRKTLARTGALAVAEREELLYLLANTLRRERRLREAVDVLGQLAASSRSHAARMADLERARLLAYRLHKPEQALQLLRSLVNRGGTDALTQQAWQELCMLHVEQRAREDARRCIDTLLRRFKNARGNKKVLELRDRLEALHER